MISDDPVVFTFVAPAIVAPCVAVRSPPKVTLSQSVAVVNVADDAFLLQNPTVPSDEPVMSPLQVRFPVAPSTVQPVSVDPPARLTDVAVLDPGPMLIVPAVENSLTVVTLVLKRFNVPVADVPNV